MFEAAFVLTRLLRLPVPDLRYFLGHFSKATLQHAVRTGVRYAITSQTMTSGGNPLGQVASIKSVVQSAAMGVLSNSDMSSYVDVSFYSVSSNPPTKVTGTGSNSAGNLVIVSVNGWKYYPIAPLLYSGAPVTMSVSAGDLIESTGTGATPPPL